MKGSEGAINAEAEPAIVQADVSVAEGGERARLAVAAQPALVDQPLDGAHHCALVRIAAELVPERGKAPNSRVKDKLHQREQTLKTLPAAPAHRWR